MTPPDRPGGLRLAVLQAAAVVLDPERNLEILRSAAQEARGSGASLILTPELFLTGYAPVELREWMTAARLAPLPERVAAIASEVGIAVASSFPSARPDGGFAITAGLWDATGAELLRYEKVHLWGDGERSAFTPGAAAPMIADWHGRRVGLQVCYDIEFPEPARHLAERGADLLLVPTAIDDRSAYVPELLVRARAAENAFVVAYADYPRAADSPSEAGFAGLSVVAGREGVSLAQAGAEPVLLIADIPDPDERPPWTADYLRDRRPDRYAAWR